MTNERNFTVFRTPAPSDTLVISFGSVQSSLAVEIHCISLIHPQTGLLVDGQWIYTNWSYDEYVLVVEHVFGKEAADVLRGLDR